MGNTNKELLKVLRQKEQDIMDEIETTEIGKQLKGIRSTIALFENGSSTSTTSAQSNGIEIPKSFDDAVTWNGKILFVLSKLGSAFVDDMAAELKKLGVTEDDTSLKRKVSVAASSLKAKKKVGAKIIGVKAKYFIK